MRPDGDQGAWAVRFTSAAQRELTRLPADAGARLRRPVLALAFDPRPVGVRAIAGSPYLRLRVGDLRVVYLVVDEERTVLVVRVARRAERTYRRL